jgi:cell division protein FtsQ
MPPVRSPRRKAPNRPAKKTPARRSPRVSRRNEGAPSWQIKLGALAHAGWRATQQDARARWAATGVAALAFFGLIALFAAGFGVLDDAGRTTARAAADTARGAGLAVRAVDVIDASGDPLPEGRRQEVADVVGLATGKTDAEPMFVVDPNRLRARVQELPWVAEAKVMRLWPNRVVIMVTPRTATAVWQVQGRLSLIDATGASVGPLPSAWTGGLPLVVGAGAPKFAPEMFAALGARPELARRTQAVVRVGERRWNLRLKSGADLMLPEAHWPAALDTALNLQVEYGLLDRPAQRIDLRNEGFLIVRPRAEARAPVEFQPV